MPRPFPWKGLRVAIPFLLAACVMFIWTEDVWRISYNLTHALDLKDLFDIANHFASEIVVAFIAAIIWNLDPGRRYTLGVLLIAFILNSAVVEPTKRLSGRARPNYSVLMDAKYRERLEAYLAENPRARIRTDGRDQWIAFSPQRPYFDNNFASFPSGHSSGAFVIATYLAALYGRARWVWYLLAVLCGLARIEKGRHFPEDVIFGSVIGWAMTSFAMSQAWAIQFGRWLEKQMSRVLSLVPWK